MLIRKNPWCWSDEHDGDHCLTHDLAMTFVPLCRSHPQRQKGSYGVYPKADPTPVTSSAPPVSTLYSSPVVSQLSICFPYEDTFICMPQRQVHVFWTLCSSPCWGLFICCLSEGVIAQQCFSTTQSSFSLHFVFVFAGCAHSILYRSTLQLMAFSLNQNMHNIFACEHA